MKQMKTAELTNTNQHSDAEEAGVQHAQHFRPASVESPVNTYSVRRAKRLARGRRFGLRTEFYRDCQLIKSTLSPWLLSWKEASGHAHDESHVDADGRIWSSQGSWGGDTDVQLIIAAHGPNLNELRWLINSIVDCHVAAETVAPWRTYTGERIGYEELEAVAVAPRASMLKKAIKALTQERKTYALFSEFHQGTIDLCQAALDGRARVRFFFDAEPQAPQTKVIWTPPDIAGLTPQAATALSKFLTVPRSA